MSDPRAALASVLSAAVLMLGACGDDGNGESATSDREPREQPAPAAEKPAAPDDPLAQAEAYAKEQFPEATQTDDSLAAAVSGCYLGITGEYLGGPANWPPEKTAKIEYPEPDLRAILDRARSDCQ